jgi:hypothetical protein
VRGTLSAIPVTAYRVDVYADAVCDPSGAAATLLGSVSIATDGSGNATFTQLFNQLAPAGQVVLGTTTELGVGTSQFSACATVASRQCPDDTMCNGYTDAQKIGLGTDPFTYCAIMRADVNIDGKVTLADLVLTAQPYNQTIPPAPARYNQNADAKITLADLILEAQDYNQPVTACP